jgi:inner membrane protein
MPTIFSHAIAATAIGRLYAPERIGGRFWRWSAYCSMLPDVDVVGFSVGIPYSAMLGHRGFTHSFAFAAIVGWLVAVLYGRRASRHDSSDGWF